MNERCTWVTSGTVRQRVVRLVPRTSTRQLPRSMSLHSERGLRTVDGLGMLLHQGALASEKWTGQAPPLPVMRAALGY